MLSIYIQHEKIANEPYMVIFMVVRTWYMVNFCEILKARLLQMRVPKFQFNETSLCFDMMQKKDYK